MAKNYVKRFDEVRDLYKKNFLKTSTTTKGNKSMLEIKDSATAMKKIVHEWEPMQMPVRISHRTLNADKIYVNCKEATLKNKTKAFYLTIYIGAEIMDLLGLKVSDKLLLLVDKNNPSYLRLAKVDKNDSHGYKIGKAAATTTCHINFRYTGLLILKNASTVEVEFDLFSDQSFMIDLAKLRARGGINYVSN